MKFKKNLSHEARINAVMEKYPYFTRMEAMAEVRKKKGKKKSKKDKNPRITDYAKDNKKIKTNKNKKIKLISKQRGVRVEERRYCNECYRFYNILWLYKESNKGPVYLCYSCKGRVRARSFGKKIDLLDLTVAGSYGSNGG